MMSRGTFSTSILIEDEIGETEYDVRVLYSRDAGYKGTYYQPAEDPSVEIISIMPADTSITVPEHFYEDESLIAECMADWAAEREEAAEWLAQERRDARLMGEG